MAPRFAARGRSATVPSVRTDRLRLPPAPSPALALAGAMHAMAQYAVGCARLAKARPALAVHAWRKAMRRARALLRLCREVLPEAEGAEIADILRGAQGAVSGRRDVDVLVPLIRQLGRDERPGPSVGAALRKVRRALKVAAPGGGAAVHDDLRAHIPSLRGASRRLEAALPAALDWGDIGRGFGQGYRRARRALARARKHHSQTRFHELRKRTKTAHYQSELLASTGFGRAERLRVKLAELARQQGAVTDLMLLAASAERLLPADDPDRRALASFLAQRIQRRRAPVDRMAVRLFRRPAREMVARIVPGASAAWSAARPDRPEAEPRARHPSRRARPRRSPRAG